MTPKEKARQLLEENKSEKDPMNFALHLCEDIIYDYKHYVPDFQKLKYWELVTSELEYIRN